VSGEASSPATRRCVLPCVPTASCTEIRTLWQARRFLDFEGHFRLTAVRRARRRHRASMPDPWAPFGDRSDLRQAGRTASRQRKPYYAAPPYNPLSGPPANLAATVGPSDASSDHCFQWSSTRNGGLACCPKSGQQEVRTWRGVVPNAVFKYTRVNGIVRQMTPNGPSWVRTVPLVGHRCLTLAPSRRTKNGRQKDQATD